MNVASKAGWLSSMLLGIAIAAGPARHSAAAARINLTRIILSPRWDFRFIFTNIHLALRAADAWLKAGRRCSWSTGRPTTSA